MNDLAVVETDRVRLRDFNESDVDNVLVILDDNAVTANLSKGADAVQAGTFVQQRIVDANRATRTDYYLVAEDAQSGRFIGMVRIGLPSESAGRLGIAVRSDEWHQGWATAICEAAIGWSAATLGLDHFDAATAPPNEKAKGLLQKLGFEKTGHTMEFEGAEGQPRDTYTLAERSLSRFLPTVAMLLIAVLFATGCGSSKPSTTTTVDVSATSTTSAETPAGSQPSTPPTIAPVPTSGTETAQPTSTTPPSPHPTPSINDPLVTSRTAPR